MPAFVRIAETERPSVSFLADGQSVKGLEGDTLLVALMVNAIPLRQSEFGDGPRAGFCLMGTCQDCWVWTNTGQKLRACTTPITSSLSVVTRPPEDQWLLQE